MSKVINNTIYYTTGSLIKAFTSFLLLPIFANILGANQYGLLSLLQTFSSLLAILMTFGIERSLYRLYYDYTKDDKNRFISTVFWSINATSIIVIIFSIICATHLSSLLGGVDAFKVVLPVIIYTFMQAQINYSQIILQIEQRGKTFLVISLLMLVLYNVLSLLCLYCYSRTYQSMIYGNLIANTLALPFAYFFIRKRIRFTFDIGMLISTLRFSFPLMLMAIFAWLLNMSDRMFLASFSDLKNLGFYSMASKIVSIMVLLEGAVFQAYGPYFFNIANTMQIEIAKPKIKIANDLITLSTGVIAILIVLFSKLLFHTILNPEYRNCLIYVYILVIGSVFGQQMGLLNPMLYQQKKTKIISIITMVGAMCSVGLNFLLIPILGPIMAAFSNMLSMFIMFGLTLLFARKAYYIKINILLLAGTIILIILCYFLDNSIPNYMISFLSKLILISIVLIIFTRMRIFKSSEIEMVIKRLSKIIINK